MHVSPFGDLVCFLFCALYVLCVLGGGISTTDVYLLQTLYMYLNVT